MENKIKQGGISVETAHIFPIIKKWLYSEKDIFLREIVSNAADAITKHKRLVSLGEAAEDEAPFAYKITVTLDKTARTLTVEDNGIGMSEEELLRYLGNIALSGAVEFIQKYDSEQADAAAGGIIGHFGLGFYSAFMVADTVEVISKSFGDAPAVHWVCSADGTYELSGSDRATHGTSVILHVTDEEEAYLDSRKIQDMLDKYCSFMPTEIFYVDADKEESESEDDAEASAPTPINDTYPLWQKSPSECTPEEYKDFYRKVFHDYREPLFWIHINADYPLNFRGILYFPRLNNEYESIEGQVKLYYNQVFVADNIKEVIPEYLLMLKGVLDCPELPLNVSRSYLQNNAYVSKVAAHIVKKVTDKLASMCNTDREHYESVWNSIKTFVEYACMRDRKFYDRAKEAILFRLTDGRYVTVAQYVEAAKDTHENTVFYATDVELQARYVSLFEAQGLQVVVLDKLIDTQFVQMLEGYDNTVKYQRIDSNVAAALKNTDEAAVENEKLTALFKEVSKNDRLEISFQSLKDASLPAMLTVSEESRRMEEMMKMYAMAGGDDADAPSFPLEYTLMLNSSAPLIGRLSELVEADEDKAKKMAAHIYRLSVLAQRKLTAEELKEFLADSFDLLGSL